MFMYFGQFPMQCFDLIKKFQQILTEFLKADIVWILTDIWIYRFISVERVEIRLIHQGITIIKKYYFGLVHILHRFLSKSILIIAFIPVQNGIRIKTQQLFYVLANHLIFTIVQ